jgi:hypothetical protein
MCWDRVIGVMVQEAIGLWLCAGVAKMGKNDLTRATVPVTAVAAAGVGGAS